MAPIKKVRLVDSVVEEMLQAIKSGRFTPGKRIPSERVLTQEFGVSRTTLREAFQKLELLGKISIRQGDGTYLNESDPENLYMEIKTAFAVGDTDITHYLEAREYLEITAARFAAERATEEDLECLNKIIQAQEEHINDSEMFWEFDFKFHQALIQAAKNNILLQFWISIAPLIKEQQTRSSTIPGMTRQAIKVHKKLIQALGEHNIKKVQNLMQEHLAMIPGRLLSDVSRRVKNKSEAKPEE